MNRSGKKWVIVAFDHPTASRSVLYRQDLDDDHLMLAVEDAVLKGANLMSIRGMPEKRKDG